MKKFIRRVVKTFKKLADSNLLTFGQNVTVSMAAAVDVFPTPVPALLDINEELQRYEDLLQSAKNRDKVQVNLKNMSKFALNSMLSQLADYVNATTTESSNLLKSGFELNKVPEPIGLLEPTGLRLFDGVNSGEIILKFKAVKGASSYLFMYTIDPALTEGSWVSFPATTSSYTFKGLTKGVTYYIRVAAVGRNQQVTNSIVVSRVSQ
jgi:hypothetical protein